MLPFSNMNIAEFNRKKNQIWASWENKYRMVFTVDFRKLIENKAEKVDYETDLKDLDTDIPEYVEPALLLLPERKISNSNIKPEKRRRKNFERRCYLVKFVLRCWERQVTSYVPWDYITNEWNKTHPSDQLGKAVLKAEYYRAISQREIIINTLPTIKWHSLKVFKLFLTRLDKKYEINPLDVLKKFTPWLDQIEFETNGKIEREIIHL